MQKSQKKKENNFLSEVFKCGFPISGDEKGGKNKWFCFFSVRGEGKGEINYKKGENFFSSLGSLFHYFWSLVCRKDD